MPEEKKSYIQVELTGLSKVLFDQLEAELLALIKKVLHSIIEKDPENVNDHIQKFEDELKKYEFTSSEMLNHHKIISEVEQGFYNKEKLKAETRKVNAEAASIEINNEIAKMNAILEFRKVFINKKGGDEEFFFERKD